MDWLIPVSTFIAAIATCVIAYYSYVSNKLANAIRAQEANYRQAMESMTEQHHKDLSDLYQAIVIATMIDGHCTTAEDSIKKFNRLYSGEIEIFKTNEAKQ